jgi:hypothetical protein
MHAHQADLDVSTDEHKEGHDAIDGDHPSQRLTSRCWCGHRLAGVYGDKQQVGTHLCSSLKPESMDGVDVEHLILLPTRSDLPLYVLYGRVGEKCQDRLVVAELFWHVGEHRVDIETVIGERETLNPFHGKEQPGKTPKNHPFLAC